MSTIAGSKELSASIKTYTPKAAQDALRRV